MGTPKAMLDWHGSTLLRRVSAVVRRAVDGPVVVVCARGQSLQSLPDGVEVVADERPGRGPLQGLAAGLDALGDRVEVAYVSSVDVPLLHPAFVRAVVGALDRTVDVAAPEVDGRVQPLAAAYRVEVRRVVAQLLADDRLALGGLLGRSRVRRLAPAELPAPQSVTNVNSRDDYERALALPAPVVRVNDVAARAWRLGDVLRGPATPTLNCIAVDPDPDLPLVAGDVISFS
jgi:molybdenum cofactor guanylyltransferase